jgi:hypothetical protein
MLLGYSTRSERMIRWSKEQLLRPAKHLCMMPGASGSSSSQQRTTCVQCGASILRPNDASLCATCRRKDTTGRTAEEVARRRRNAKYSLVAPFDPARPSCAFCVNYKGHLCAFGFPEALHSRDFARHCSCYEPLPGLVEASKQSRDPGAGRPPGGCGACHSCPRSQKASQG